MVLNYFYNGCCGFIVYMPQTISDKILVSYFYGKRSVLYDVRLLYIKTLKDLCLAFLF